MLKANLIKAIYDNEDEWSCPEYTCDKPENEGNTGECCWECAKRQLEEYERSIKAETIEKICEYVRTDEFKAEWVNSKGVPFGDFLAEKIKGYSEMKSELNNWEIEFPARLQRALKAAGLTQKELADKMGITEASMSRYANANRVPKATTIISMAAALKVTTDFLLYGKEG